LVRKEGIRVIRVWEHSLNDPIRLGRTIRRIQDILVDTTKHEAPRAFKRKRL
jgi:G:T-mismatch repair DNA endonuclease (very short patch repair protein)